MPIQRSTQHNIQSANLADLLERVLDKGIVIAGDIKIKLVEVELLTLQIRLVICSVDKAQEMGMDWWVNNPIFTSNKSDPEMSRNLAGIEERLAKIESSLTSEARV